MLLSVGILGIVALYVLIYGTATHGSGGGGGGGSYSAGGYSAYDHPQHTSSGSDAVSSHKRTIVEGDVIKSINPILKSGLENLIERGGKGSGGSKTTGGKGREPFQQAPTVSNAPGFYGGEDNSIDHRHWWDFMNRVVEEQVSNVDTGAHTSTETSTITSTDHPKPQAACPGYDEYWRKFDHYGDGLTAVPLSKAEWSKLNC